MAVGDLDLAHLVLLSVLAGLRLVLGVEGGGGHGGGGGVGGAFIILSSMV